MKPNPTSTTELENRIKELENENQILKHNSRFQLLQQLLNLLVEGIKIIDMRGRIAVTNQAYANFNHLTIDEVLGKKCNELLCTGNCNTDKCCLRQIQAGKELLEFEITRKGETEQHFLINVKPFKDGKGEILGLLESFIDITTLKHAHDKLLELNTAKDKFISILAHDLKNPLGSMVGLIDLIISRFDKYDRNKIYLFLEQIQKTGQTTYLLLENILQWARTQQGTIVFSPEKVNTTDLFAEVLDTQVHAAQLKNIALQLHKPQIEYLHIDKNMIKTTLNNLIGNAIKFTPQNGTIQVSLTQEDGFAVFTITDNGVGITPENQKKLFRIDGNLSTLGTQNERGTGFGLLLCREFVEKHGGTIGLKSQPEHGSQFFFKIPI